MDEDQYVKTYVCKCESRIFVRGAARLCQRSTAESCCLNFFFTNVGQKIGGCGGGNNYLE